MPPTLPDADGRSLAHGLPSPNATGREPDIEVEKGKMATGNDSRVSGWDSSCKSFFWLGVRVVVCW